MTNGKRLNTITRDEFKRDLLGIISEIDERIDLGLLQRSRPYDQLDSHDRLEITQGIEEKYDLKIEEQNIETAYFNRKVDFENFVSSWYEIYVKAYDQNINQLLKNI